MHRWSKGWMVAGLCGVMAVTCAAQQEDRSSDAQSQDDRPALIERKPESEQPRRAESKVSIPAGAQILVSLQHAITTKSAKVGDPVYAITSFPFVQNEQVLIPAGTYVQGRISEIKRPGRLKGRAELLFHFSTLIYPNGYTVMLPGAVENVPGMDHSTMKDQEGTIQENGQKAEKAGKVARDAGIGGAVGGTAGALSGGLTGARAGGLTGIAIGSAMALFARGQDVRLESGTAVQMVTQRPIELDADRIGGRSMRGEFRRLEPR